MENFMLMLLGMAAVALATVDYRSANKQLATSIRFSIWLLGLVIFGLGAYRFIV